MAAELDIIRLYDHNLRGFYTINAIAGKLNKAYPFIHRKVKELLQLGVLSSVAVGGSKCVTINLKNRRAVLYLTELELQKRSTLPETVQAIAKQLETDGTLAIQTAIYSKGNIYVVGEGLYTGTHTITVDELQHLLLTTKLFEDHTILHGYERFFTYLASMQKELDSVYNPLVIA